MTGHWLDNLEVIAVGLAVWLGPSAVVFFLVWLWL